MFLTKKCAYDALKTPTVSPHHYSGAKLRSLFPRRKPKTVLRLAHKTTIHYINTLPAIKTTLFITTAFTKLATTWATTRKETMPTVHYVKRGFLRRHSLAPPEVTITNMPTAVDKKNTDTTTQSTATTAVGITTPLAQESAT